MNKDIQEIVAEFRKFVHREPGLVRTASMDERCDWLTQKLSAFEAATEKRVLDKIHEAVMLFGREVGHIAMKVSKEDGTHDHFAAKIKYTDVLEKEDILYAALNPTE